ncbi:MAG: gliding motility-associated C-terminal domain-containing protein [Flavobacteriales bacterium]|nr:gliding motility-associated C-terminal domain-containing protein [Flavobacteriales bacterium]
MELSRSNLFGLLLILLGTCSAQHVRADHYSGGNITYRCLGGNFFEVTLDVYLDCSGAPLTSQSLELSNDCGVTFTANNLPLVLTEEVSQLCGAAIPNSTCNGGTLPGIRHYQFRVNLFLSPCDDWTISWNICCRTGLQNTSGTPGMYLEATVNNAGGLCDSSPALADNSIPFVCVNEPVLYNTGFNDPDGNTMSFELISARFAAPAPTNITYSPGFTGTEPVPGITIDPATGQIGFTPTTTGSYVVVVQVTTYDVNGIPLGTVMRDFLFVVSNCSNTPPLTTGLTNSTTGFITSAGSIEVCDGLPFCVDIPFTDADPGAITLTSNVAALLPGATFTITGSNPVVGRLCWTPDPAYSPANILVTARDNACPIPNEASTSILITVVEPPAVPPNAGVDGGVSSCAAGPAIALFPLLGGTPDLGGVWTDPNGAVHGGSFTPSADPFGAYIYRVGNGCQTDAALVTVNANGGADPGVSGMLAICANAASEPLIDALGGTPQSGGTWSGPSPIAGGVYDPASMAPGIYTYTVPGVAPCPNASATVTVSESAPPNAGTNGTLSICSNGSSVGLVSRLGGAPQTGGTWSGPSTVAGGNYDPATMLPGVYTYTVAGSGACVNATATVTVTENTQPVAGTNGSVTLCSNGVSIALSASLGGTPQAGGTWSGPSAVAGGNYDPATMLPGVYTYMITGTAPCTNATATVTVTENAAPNAGTNGTLDVCGNDASVALSASLGGTPQAGGTWSGPSAVAGGNYDPATMTPGVYTYTVTGTAPCTNATATVTVTENGAPNAGTNGTLDVCSNGASVALSASLGGTPQAGGTWSGPSTVVGGNYDPATMTSGVYTYTVTGTAPCTNATATVTVTENAAPNAGTNGTLDVCSNGASVALSALLGGTPQAGGTWSGPSTVAGGNYDPATMLPGVYTYMITGTAPCTNATATVTVTENAAPNAGTNGTLDVCGNGASVALSASLGGTPQTGGTWSGPSAVVGGNYDPATMNAGVYTYTVLGTTPCTNAAATVTVTENSPPDAGTSGTLDACSNGAGVALSASLGGSPQAGGSWSGPSTVVGGQYDPATMVSGVYTYTVNGTAPCTNAIATVTVNETGSPNAGTDGAITLCSSGTAVDLFAQLGGAPDAGGTWSGPSALVGSNYDPATMTPGVYTYTLNATAPCSSANADVMVTEEIPLSAGANATLPLCEGAPVQVLFDVLQGEPDGGGEWSGPAGSFSGQFDPGTDPGGVYTYAHVGVNCPSAMATVTINIQAGPDAGQDVSLSLCSNSGSAQLFDLLGGTPDGGGIWTLPNATPAPSIFDPLQSDGGTFIYTVSGGVDCPNDQATVSIVVHLSPRSGTSGTLPLCANASVGSLFEGLTGTLDAGGAWTAPDGSAHSSTIDPANDVAGLYTYTVTGIAPCVSAASTVNVLIAPVPNAGEDAVAVQCSSNAPFQLTAALAGSPQTNGSWHGPDGEVVSALFAPASDESGTYTYTVNGTAPCGNDQATLVVVVHQAADAGSSTTVQVCENAAEQLDLLQQLIGTPDPSGSWIDPEGGSFDGTLAPADDMAGPYTYAVAASAPCPAAVAIVDVIIIPTPVATLSVVGADGCAPAEVTLSSSYSGSGSCQWTLWNGETINDCAPITRSIEEPGSYGASLVIDAGNGCGVVTVDAPALFELFGRPQAAFLHLPEVVNTLDPLVGFHNTSVGGNSFLWDIAGFTTSTDLHTSFTFPTEFAAEYTVCLTAVASANCVDTACHTITIEDGLNVFVPNTFTPDGDGNNDGFKPLLIGADPDSYRFYIFDRWGQPLYETNDPAATWDGNFSDGTEVPIGVYVWKLVVKDAVTTSRVERVGHVTLLR